MWADNETSDDLLGFKVHADIIVDVINDDDVLPVTIGVFGDWGSGKSSILQIVKEKFGGFIKKYVIGIGKCLLNIDLTKIGATLSE